ncbi:MAG: ABC transporter ATP-binding protein [Acidobacteria bacterium]|nr:ABC transporter ATP-binding protein [Acidobacteriota bacterium]MBV9475580.1 ABC transporter ATP-binding protein [Acidobacteriota bacterium]
MRTEIHISGLRKVYGQVTALDGLDLDIGEGELFGLLGPNGAGKTTTIGILTTRVLATSGTAVVAGRDVGKDPVGARRMIGVVPQRPNPDRSLLVGENLVFHATYFGIPRAEASRRTDALLEQLGLTDKKKAKADALSGGQQQRLMIARALIHEPRVLFLDEPTVGLDPQARLALWDVLRELHGQGRTIVMTTHYMEEADQLCDRVAIVDRGKLLALDTPSELKAKAPGETIIEVTLDRPLPDEPLSLAGVTRTEVRGPVVRAFAERAAAAVPSLLSFAESRGYAVKDIHLSKPSLETLFISLTGRKLA